ncbi:MAG TPA: hypothetical protein VHE35_00445 [Kofleriaceae bacterium]|nr:hypothetical protein [Kofleriaceae bacterium]
MTTVLFVHGLESGPHGRKVRVLTEAGFDVVARRMPCSRPYVARDPLVIAAVAAAAGAALFAFEVGGLLGLVGALAIAAAMVPRARAALATRVFRRSVEVQRRALEQHRIDVVVGSSFGGAVTVELLRSGAWRGRTVLLCPAHVLVAHRGRRAAPSLRSLPAEVRERIVVVHGEADDIVPVSHSKVLVHGTGARLILVDDDHRLTATATADNLSAWIALTARPPAA